MSITYTTRRGRKKWLNTENGISVLSRASKKNMIYTVKTKNGSITYTFNKTDHKTAEERKQLRLRLLKVS